MKKAGTTRAGKVVSSYIKIRKLVEPANENHHFHPIADALPIRATTHFSQSTTQFPDSSKSVIHSRTTLARPLLLIHQISTQGNMKYPSAKRRYKVTIPHGYSMGSITLRKK